MICESCKNKIFRGDAKTKCVSCNSPIHKNCGPICATCIKEGKRPKRMDLKEFKESLGRIGYSESDYDVDDVNMVIFGFFVIKYSDGYRYWYSPKIFYEEIVAVIYMSGKQYWNRVHNYLYEFKYRDIDIKAEIIKIV